MTDSTSLIGAIRHRLVGHPITAAVSATLLLVLLVLPPVLGRGNEFVLTFLIGLLVFTSLAISFNLIAGYAGQFSLGHILFYGVGAYTCTVAVVNYGVHWLVGILLAAVVGIVVAAVVGAITLRLRNIYFATGTLAVAEFTRIAMNNWDYVEGSSGMRVPSEAIGYSVVKWYYVVLAITAASVAISLVFEFSVFGSRLEAIRDNESKAQAVGINTWIAKNLAFVISAIPAAAIGAAHVLFLQAIRPSDAFDPMISIQMQLMVILGGLGTVLGPIIGGAVFYGVRELSVFVHPRLHLLITGPTVVIIILFAPQGVVELLRTPRQTASDFVDWVVGKVSRVVGWVVNPADTIAAIVATLTLPFRAMLGWLRNLG